MTLLICVIALVLIAEFINGWTDAPNAIATVVSTSTLSPRTAIPMAVVLNVMGAMSGTAVAATVGTGIVAADAVTLETVGAAMVSVIAWGILAARIGIPISKSHALLAGIAGAGIAGGGWSALMWAGWTKVLWGLIASLAIGFGAAFLLGTGIILFLGRVSPSRAQPAFSVAHVLTAAAMAFSHGMNDGQKFIGVLTLVLVLGGVLPSFEVPYWVVFLCSLTMGLGTSFGGFRIIATVGQKMGHIATWQGCAATAAASSTIIIASHFGVPLSTTHTITTAIAGANSSLRFSNVRWSVLGGIMRAWVLTFPCCGFIAYLAASLVRLLNGTC